MRPFSQTRSALFAFFLAILVLPAARPMPAQSPPGAATPTVRRDARKAKKAFEKGVRAERTRDWQTAYEAFGDAAAYAPDNTEYALRRDLARFQVVQMHTEQAERDFLVGRTDQAREELRTALRLDPGYSVAQERLAQLDPATPQQPVPTTAALSAPPQVRPLPGQRDFDYRGDTRGAYEEVARQFGLTALFDGELAPRPVRFRLPQADFETAMLALNSQTNTFWRAVDAHTLFVAENTPEKRRAYAPLVVRTLVLPGSLTPDEMTQTMRIVREIAGVMRTDLDPASRTLTLRGSPADIALAQAIVQEIEQPRGELMLEIELLEVDRDAARQLGLTPPSSARLFSLSQQDIRALQRAQNNGTLLAVLQSIFGTPGPLTTGQTGLSALVPPLVAFGGGRTVFLAHLPGMSANFSQTLNLLHSAQRMFLRVEDGQPATFFVGERFPVTLALLSSNLAVPTTQFSSQVLPGAFPRTDFPTGKSPAGVAVADFNGDGRLDVAVVNQDDNTVSILLGHGDGTFDPKTDFPTGRGPVAVAAGDYNGDGKADLAIVNQTDNTVSILLGRGDGTFTSKTDFATGNSPTAIALADFNADGKPDLAVANQADDTVSILLGRGDGTFLPKKDFATGTGPVSVATADFDSDGRIDLALANKAANSISILLGRGDGTFAAKTDFPAGNQPVAVAAADFNSDSHPDLAVANHADNSVSILLGNGDGTFRAKADFPTAGGPTAVIAQDLNFDNRPDIGLVDQTANSVSVLLSLGNGTFAGRLDLPTGNEPVALAAGDLNGDGRPDLVIANQSSNSVTVILNTAQFPVAPIVPQTPYPASTYEDLGLKVRATPRLHADDEVTLNLEFEIRSLAGTAINGIPIISNRAVEQSVRLRENETTVLSGIVQREETRAITGWPALGEISGAGHLAGRRNAEKRDTELIIAITPRQLRLAPRKDRSIYAGPDIRSLFGSDPADTRGPSRQP